MKRSIFDMEQHVGCPIYEAPAIEEVRVSAECGYETSFGLDDAIYEEEDVIW